MPADGAVVSDTEDDLAPKAPPVRFDRAPDGRLVVPGRCWQGTFERTAEEPEDPTR
jgi:hypothetical protein